MGRIVVEGALAAYAEGLRRYLVGQGYALDSVRDHVHLLADLSGWLAVQGVLPGELTEQAAGEFLRARRGAGHRVGVSRRALAPTLEYLRSLRIVPQPSAMAALTGQEILLAEYQRARPRRPAVSAGRGR